MADVRDTLLLLSCDAGRPMANEVAKRLDRRLVRAGELWFASGEGKFVIEENVRGADLYIFQSMIAPGDKRSIYDRFVMLLHAVEAASLSDASSVTVVMAYYPGARQDKRKGRVREGISAGLFARMLQEAGANRVVSVEIHNEAIAGMFDPGTCRLENVYLSHRMAQWLKQKKLCGSMVASPDVGGMERARRYAAELDAGLVALSKERDYATANKVVRSTLIGDVQGKDVLLVDDIIDTGGSVVAAVDELKGHGATDITVACAHPVFSDPAWERLGGLAERASREGWSFRVVGSSSIRHVGAPSWYHTFAIEPLIAEIIRYIHVGGSITRAQQSDEPLGGP
jgi:ribose-phosphate pyrophosphokinase